MKHLRRTPWLSAISLIILAVMCLPLAVAALSVDTLTGGATLAASGLFGAPLMLMDEVGKEGSENGGGADAPKLTIGQRMSAALASKESLQSKIAAHEVTIAEHETTLAAHDQTITELRAQLAERETKIAALEADAAEVTRALEAAEANAKELASREQNIESRAEGKAKEKVAALGFPAAKLPAASEQITDDVPASRDALEEKMSELKTVQERRELLTKYRAAQATAHLN